MVLKPTPVGRSLAAKASIQPSGTTYNEGQLKSKFATLHDPKDSTKAPTLRKNTNLHTLRTARALVKGDHAPYNKNQLKGEPGMHDPDDKPWSTEYATEVLHRSYSSSNDPSNLVSAVKNLPANQAQFNAAQLKAAQEEKEAKDKLDKANQEYARNAHGLLEAQADELFQGEINPDEIRGLLDSGVLMLDEDGDLVPSPQKPRLPEEGKYPKGKPSDFDFGDPEEGDPDEEDDDDDELFEDVDSDDGLNLTKEDLIEKNGRGNRSMLNLPVATWRDLAERVGVDPNQKKAILVEAVLNNTSAQAKPIQKLLLSGYIDKRTDEFKLNELLSKRMKREDDLEKLARKRQLADPGTPRRSSRERTLRDLYVPT